MIKQSLEDMGPASRERAAAGDAPGGPESVIESAITEATSALLGQQRTDGHWVFELEADATIPAEYVLLQHFLGEPAAPEIEAKIAVYLRRIQGGHGGWPLFHDGAFNISASVKAYFALKTIGDSPDADHMRRARTAILAHGGAAASNVFTRCLLALFGALDVVLRIAEPWFPKGSRKKAIDKAVAFVIERLNGEDGLGAIFPAMANTVMMFEVLGYPASDPRVATARRAVDKLLVAKGDEIYCQPCFSPVWDTGLVCHALLEVGSPKAVDCVLAGLQWLKPLQVLDAAGDWADQRPD